MDKVHEYELERRAVELAVEEFQGSYDSLKADVAALREAMSSMQCFLESEISRRKQAESRSRKLEQ